MINKEMICATALLLCTCSALRAQDTVDVIFSGTPSSPIVSWVIQGGGTFQSNTAARQGFVVFAISFDAFDPILDARVFDITGTGSVVNTTTGDVGIFQSMTIDHDPLVNDDFNVRFTTFPTSIGDRYTIDGAGTIDLSIFGATFDDMNVGSGVGTVFVGAEDNWTITITEAEPIPVPAAFWAGIPAFTLLAARRWRSSANTVRTDA